MLTYNDSSWAARRWDWFNKPSLVVPLSYCQFWRTVLVYATLKWILTPLRFLPKPLLRLLLAGGRVLWFLAWPLRLVIPLIARPSAAAAVRVCNPIVDFGEQHKETLTNLYVLFVFLYMGSVVIAAIVFVFLASWFWSLVGIGGLVVGSLALFGFIKTGAPGLLWQATVAAKHGICPPVMIVRD